VHLSLPVTNPVLVFALAMGIFLVAPLIMRRYAIPGIIGIIGAGAIVGPNGLHVLDRDATIVLLGTVGLIYLMFLAGVEIDLHGFRRHRTQSLVLGGLSFAIPLLLGFGLGRLLGLGTASAWLIGAMLASHTLIAYPIALSLDIGRTPAVIATVGGTMIADTAALLVLAVVAASSSGRLDALFWLRLVLSLGALGAVILLGLPRLARWYFRRETTGAAAPFVFVMAALFAAAVLAEIAGVEPIVGAFLAGLALNRLIPTGSLLNSRVHFVGEAFLIPFFLLWVGMRVDVRVLAGGGRAWLVLGGLLVAGVASKWLAAALAGRVFRHSREERGTVFGLSVSRASATLAIALVGLELGLFDRLVENGAVALMMVTCFLGPWLVERHGRALALREEHEPAARPAERILVPMSKPRTAQALLDLALLLQQERSAEPIRVLTVVPEEDAAPEVVANAELMLSKAVAYAVGAGIPVRAVTRLDQNFAAGIVRGAVETRTTTVVIGWDGRASRRWVFGSVLDQLLEQSTQHVIVAKLGHPVNSTRRLVMLVPRGADHHPGFAESFAAAKRLARRLSADMLLIAVEGEVQVLAGQARAVKPPVPFTTRGVGSWSGALGLLRETLRADDLVVVLSARRGTVSWRPHLERLPARLARLVPESFLLMYPPERAGRAAQVLEEIELPRALSRARIVTALPGRSAHAALDALLEREYPDDRGRRRDILRALLHSRRGAALEIAPGAVVAHARLDFLKAPQLFIGRSAGGVPFPRTERPASLVVLLLSPTDQPEEHLAVLADVARLVSDPARLARLLSARSEQDLVAELGDRGIADRAVSDSERTDERG
jgi:Kef-type K+ transport system membrane component KefB/mannitol/fructose-specific phosphotransferase system IIA component (Ntr-type)